MWNVKTLQTLGMMCFVQIVSCHLVVWGICLNIPVCMWQIFYQTILSKLNKCRKYKHKKLQRRNICACTCAKVTMVIYILETLICCFPCACSPIALCQISCWTKTSLVYCCIELLERTQILYLQLSYLNNSAITPKRRSELRQQGHCWV